MPALKVKIIFHTLTLRPYSFTVNPKLILTVDFSRKSRDDPRKSPTAGTSGEQVVMSTLTGFITRFYCLN